MRDILLRGELEALAKASILGDGDGDNDSTRFMVVLYIGSLWSNVQFGALATKGIAEGGGTHLGHRGRPMAMIVIVW